MPRNRIGLGFRSSTVAGLLTVAVSAASPLGCGRTTSLGDARNTAEGGASGGTTDGGSSGGNAGQGANGGSAGAGNSGQGGGGASAGASGASAGGTANDGGRTTLPCGLPQPSPNPNQTPEERERATLAHDFCAALAEHDCLDEFIFVNSVSAQAQSCAVDERIVACEQDLLYSAQWLVGPTCDDEWRALMACNIAADHRALGCHRGGFRGEPFGYCYLEDTALVMCPKNAGLTIVNGQRGKCEVHWSDDRCEVVCGIGTNSFHSKCEGAPGLPLECSCWVNGRPLPDGGTSDQQVFYASDCHDAGQAMADGECIERLDCCIKYPRANDSEYCGCLADPRSLGEPSCEAAAQRAGGQVVPICPQFKSDFGGLCWPPESC